MWTLRAAAIAASLLSLGAAAGEVHYYDVPKGSHPHDVAPAPDGTVWFTAQRTGKLGRLDPKTGRSELVPLGEDSAPHGVIVGPDGAAWVTDGGQNAIVRVDPATKVVKVFPLPKGTAYANLNTCVFDRNGILWYTGQSGYYGSVDPRTGAVKVWESPRGPGTYGITVTPSGDVYYASLAGNHIARIDTATGRATPIDPPTKGQGARRVWSDSKGRVWVSEWNSGNLSRYDPKDGSWKSWKPEGPYPHTYAVYVDENDHVWISEWSSNSLLEFDPAAERFVARYRSDVSDAGVRQILGRSGETWGAESGNDRLVVVRR